MADPNIEFYGAIVANKLCATDFGKFAIVDNNGIKDVKEQRCHLNKLEFQQIKIIRITWRPEAHID